MLDCGTTGGNDHGTGFVDRSDKCRLYEAMACYVKAREEITHLKATLENLRNIVTTGNESKESFIRRVNAVLHPSNAGAVATGSAAPRAESPKRNNG